MAFLSLSQHVAGSQGSLTQSPKSVTLGSHASFMGLLLLRCLLIVLLSSLLFPENYSSARGGSLGERALSCAFPGDLGVWGQKAST